MMKPHTVELNGKIMEKESVVHKHTHIYSLKESHSNKNIIVIIFVQPCFACYSVTNASTQSCLLRTKLLLHRLLQNIVSLCVNQPYKFNKFL